MDKKKKSTGFLIFARPECSGFGHVPDRINSTCANMYCFVYRFCACCKKGELTVKALYNYDPIHLIIIFCIYNWHNNGHLICAGNC